jgi:hypothetical protein
MRAYRAVRISCLMKANCSDIFSESENSGPLPLGPEYMLVQLSFKPKAPMYEVIGTSLQLADHFDQPLR